MTESLQGLQDKAASMIAHATQLGATACEVAVGQGKGFSISVREAKVDEQTSHLGGYASMTLYRGQKVASLSLHSLSMDVLKEHIDRAYKAAGCTEEDPAAGLAPKERMATDFIDDDVYHPWQDLTLEKAAKMALGMEKDLLSVDACLSVDSIEVATDVRDTVYANSHGFVGVRQSSRHSLYACAMATEGSDKHRDDAYSVARHQQDLASPESLAKLAASRALARRQARIIASRKCPVIFEARIAARLIGHYLSAMSGGALYREASFLVGQEGKPLFHSSISLLDDPHIKRALGSRSFDADGVATQKRYLVEDGVLCGVLLSAYTARQLGRESTGNAGGAHNVCLQSKTSISPDALLGTMDRGFLVTELIGQGVDRVTGDVSWGAFGFWVENGEVKYPVHEVTLASSLQAMAMGCIAVGNDVRTDSRIRTGSLLIEEMTLAGQA